MVFFGDKLVTWDKRSPEENTPQIQALIQEYAEAEKEVSILSYSTHEKGWAAMSFHAEYTSKANFENLLDFLVNTPGLKNILTQPEKRKNWLWKRLKKEIFAQAFLYQDKLLNLLRNLSQGVTIQEGWLLYTDYARLDEDTTCSKSAYLIESDIAYLYLTYYSETIH